MTGERCPIEKLSKRGLGLVHRFDTDVRLFRFLTPLPESQQGDIMPRHFHERLARTLAEALRLAACKLLQVQPTEIRATYRLYGATGNTIEIVLYDAVPGGAGYCARLGEAEFSFDALLRCARDQLDCRAHCDTACRVCLCDYGNQRYWNSFDRISTLIWLDTLFDPNAQQVGPGNYVRWIKPSLSGLNERLVNFAEIHLVARSLVEQSIYSEDSLSLLLQWLQADKIIHIYVTSQMEQKPKDQIQLIVYRRLHPYMQEGRLRLYQIPDVTGMDWSNLPRVFVSNNTGMPIIRQHFAMQPLLKGLIGESADVGTVDNEISVDLSRLLALSVSLPPDSLREGDRMSMWELQPGEKRDLASIFSVVVGCYIKELVIRDPYCGANPNRGSLTSFLTAIKLLADSIEHVAIYCKESRDRDGDVEFHLDVERYVDRILVSLGLESRSVNVSRFKGGGPTFHDREIDITFVTADGCDMSYRFFLTGGIDYLMNEQSQTRVFCVQL